MIKSCYIHIPFCKNICNYCDFCKNYYNEKIVLSYLDALKKEIKENYNNELLNTLYIGGGTPSCLNYNELDKLFEITKLFNLSDDYEFTFECNYEDINEIMLRKLKENKVNRISIGIQTFNEKFKQILGRGINKKDMISKINLAKKYFNNINIDLMYALPLESLEELKCDVLDIINMKVSHISTYSLIVEKNTKLGIKKIKETNDDLQRKMYDMIIDILSKNGYQHYEISNFSKIGYESKHNLTYWNNLEYYGFGAGASGFVSNIRYDNTKSVFKYINGVNKIYEEKIDKITKIKDEIMLGFRKTKGINKSEFKEKYNIELLQAFDLNKMIMDGLLKDDSLNIYIPDKYMFVSNEIILRAISNCNLNL